jgi:hypothetical protein
MDFLSSLWTELLQMCTLALYFAAPHNVTAGKTLRRTVHYQAKTLSKFVKIAEISYGNASFKRFSTKNVQLVIIWT